MASSLHLHLVHHLHHLPFHFNQLHPHQQYTLPVILYISPPPSHHPLLHTLQVATLLPRHLHLSTTPFSFIKCAFQFPSRHRSSSSLSLPLSSPTPHHHLLLPYKHLHLPLSPTNNTWPCLASCKNHENLSCCMIQYEPCVKRGWGWGRGTERGEGKDASAPLFPNCLHQLSEAADNDTHEQTNKRERQRKER